MITYNDLRDAIKPWMQTGGLKFIHFHTEERFMPQITIISVPVNESVVIIDLLLQLEKITLEYDPTIKVIYFILTLDDITCDDESHLITIDYNQSPKTTSDTSMRTRTGTVIVMDQEPVNFVSEIHIGEQYTNITTKIGDTTGQTNMGTGFNTYASQKTYNTINRNIMTVYFNHILKQYNLQFKKGKILKYK